MELASTIKSFKALNEPVTSKKYFVPSSPFKRPNIELCMKRIQSTNKTGTVQSDR